MDALEVLEKLVMLRFKLVSFLFSCLVLLRLFLDLKHENNSC